MSTDRPNVMERLTAAAPAVNLPHDDAARAQVWSTVSRGIRESTPQHRARRPRLRGVPRAAGITFGAMLVLVGAALAAGLVPIGSPAKTFEGFQSASTPDGMVAGASVRVLPLSAPDPQGGPPWGIRVFSTSRGAGCIQLGRLVDGQIGVLGEDGAFGNDGRFHSLPVASTDDMTCVALDANGHIFNNVSKSDLLANGLIGPEKAPSSQLPEAHDVCAPAVASPAEKTGAENRICPQSAERDVYYGLLGPDATSITYVHDGTPVTVATRGPEGAYLIVTNSAPGWRPNSAYGAGATGIVPVDSPITEIHYDTGGVCHLTGGSDEEGACSPALKMPMGFVPPAATPTPSQVAAPVSGRVIAIAGGRSEAIISFNAPVAIDSVRDHYMIEWKNPGGTPAAESVKASEADVNVGQEISVRTGPLPSGSTDIEAVLQHASGPALLEGPGTVNVPVGHVTVTVP